MNDWLAIALRVALLISVIIISLFIGVFMDAEYSIVYAAFLSITIISVLK